MTPEELKIIAEGRGYKCSVINNEVCIADGMLDTEVYNPLTNDTQCMEIMEKLKISVHYWIDKWRAARYTKKDGLGVEFTGKTINEAVCKAALEYYKERNNEL